MNEKVFSYVFTEKWRLCKQNIFVMKCQSVLLFREAIMLRQVYAHTGRMVSILLVIISTP